VRPTPAFNPGRPARVQSFVPTGPALEPRMRLAPALLTLPFVAALAAAQPATPPPASAPPPGPRPSVHAIRATEAIVVDGVLSEPAWKAASVAEQMPQADPLQGAPSSQRTDVRVVYDDDAIYVGARLYDTNADSIVSRVTRRDNLNGSDLFAVALDTFHDRRTGYYFGISVAGTQFDGTMMNDDWDDDSWDGVWSARTKRDAEGWTVEMRIPFSQMRCAGGEQRVWGVNFERFIGRRNEDDKLVFTPRGQSGFVSRFPELVGLDGIRSSHTVEITPYTTGKAEYLVHGAGDPFHDGSRYTPALGADLRTNVGAKLTLNATVNPDFGQVEIDPAVVNLSDVETYFNEKRPFFTEGLSVFRCGNNGASDYWNFNWPEPTFFYTRRIGRSPEASAPGDPAFVDAPLATHILGAVKLTGQPMPALNFGTLHAVAQKEMADYQLSSGARGSAVVEPLTYYGVLRGLRSFNHERQGLGVMTLETARSLDGTGLTDVLNRNAVVTAVDGWSFLDAKKRWVVSGYTAGTRIDGTAARIASLESDPRHYYQRPDRSDLGIDANATSLSGGIGRLWLNKQTGPWMSNSAIGFITPGFEANDLGYNSRGDLINGHVGVGYSWNKPNAWKKYFWVLGALVQGWDFGGNHTLSQAYVGSSLEQINAWSWHVEGGYFAPTMNARLTRGGPKVKNIAGEFTSLNWDTNSKSKLFLYLSSYYNRDEAGSHENYVEPGVTWRPSSNLSFSAGPNFDRNIEDAHFLTGRADVVPTPTYGSRYVFARLEQSTAGATMRMDCSLSPTLSVQVFVQPLVSSGTYSDYKELARAGTYDFSRYGTGGSTIVAGGDSVVVDPDGAGPANRIRLSQPNFTYRSIRGNAVLRWEYVPGSAFYLVWTQDRSASIDDGRFHLSPALSALGRTPANNILMVKVSHHFEL
jgi:hypothetical protein